jgi:DNA-binding response OmpR family regulator
MILIVDDEDMVLTVTAKMLAHVGYSVITACNGREGVDQFRAHADDIKLVILDVSMPVMSGDEAFRQMRAIRPDAVIALSTGLSDEDDTPARTGLQPNGLIHKPYEMKSLVESVRALLADGRTPAGTA